VRLTLAELPIPCEVVAREFQRLAEMCLHGAIDGEADHVVEQVVTDGADNVRRPHHVPLGAGLLAICVERILLWVVEIGLERYPGVCLERRVRGRADVEAILLGTSLKEEALWLEAGVLETLCEVDD
jgi:hypothetical protein